MSRFTNFSPIFNFGKKGEFNNTKALSDWAAEFKNSISSMRGLLSDKSTRIPFIKQLIFGDESKRDTEIPELLDLEDISKKLTKLKQSGKDLPTFFEDEDIESTSAMGRALSDAAKEADIMSISVNDVSKANKEYIKSQTKISKSFSAQGLFGLGKSTLKTLGSAALNIGASLVIEKAFEVGAQVLYNWTHAAEIAIEKGNEARKTISEVYAAMTERKASINQLASEATGETYETRAESIDALAEKYAELSKGVNSRTNENMSLSTEDYQLYLNISNQLADVLPGLVSGLDSWF